MILCLGTTPAVQRVLVFRNFKAGAVNRAVRTLEGAAGKSINVAKVLKALGEKPAVVTFLGGDRGRFLKRILEEHAIEHDGIEAHAQTRQCVTVIDETTRTVTELVEESPAVTQEEFARLRDCAGQRLQECRAVILSGTLAPGVPVQYYAECVRSARATGKLSVVDAQGEALSEALRAGPSVVKPNHAELAATVGRRLGGDAAVMAAMREIRDRGADSVVVTSGKESILAFDGRCFYRILPPRIEAINPIGSGDAFAAGLVWRRLRGDDLGEACRWAAACGSANALELFAGEVNTKLVEELARQVAMVRVSDRAEAL